MTDGMGGKHLTVQSPNYGLMTNGKGKILD